MRLSGVACACTRHPCRVRRATVLRAQLARRNAFLPYDAGDAVPAADITRATPFCSVSGMPCAAADQRTCAPRYAPSSGASASPAFEGRVSYAFGGSVQGHLAPVVPAVGISLPPPRPSHPHPPTPSPAVPRRTRCCCRSTRWRWTRSRRRRRLSWRRPRGSEICCGAIKRRLRPPPARWTRPMTYRSR